MSVKDAKYFEKKNVILCRSGIQEYTYNEVLRMGLSNPPVKKDVYKVYRPASVISSAIEKMTNLPITKEHPPEFINGDNWQRYAHGYTGSDAELVSIGSGEVGVKSSLVFSTSDVYNYYLDGNEEVSLGYESSNEWVQNPEAVGYDIIMTEIRDTNHLAVTAAGRGGSRVAIIDSLLGGIMSFKTGLFHFLKGKGKTTDASTPFSKIVFDSIEKSKTLSGEALDAEVRRVTDSIATLKDSEHKTLLVDMVKDCYMAMDSALANKVDVSKVIDSAYKKAEEDTLKNLDAFPDKEDEKKKDEEKKSTDSEEETKDEDGKGKGTENAQDSDPGKKEEPGEKKKEAMDSIMDSVKSLVQDALKEFSGSLSASIKEEVAKNVKEALGLSAAAPAGGSVADSVKQAKPEVNITDFVSL